MLVISGRVFLNLWVCLKVTVNEYTLVLNNYHTLNGCCMVMYVHMYLCGQFVVVRVIMTGAYGFMLHIAGHCIL
jgi:hypothetical protein